MPHSQRPWWWNCSRMGSLLCLILALGCLSGARAEETSPLLNNPGFEEGAEGWGLPPTYQVVDDVARTGRRSFIGWRAKRSPRSNGKFSAPSTAMR